MVASALVSRVVTGQDDVVRTARRCWLAMLLIVAANTVVADAFAQSTLPTVTIVSSTSAEVVSSCGDSISVQAGTVTLQRTDPNSGPLAVMFTVSGDVTPTSGSVNFAAGTVTATVDITPNGLESTFTFAVSPSADYTLGDPHQVYVLGLEAHCDPGPPTPVPGAPRFTG